MSDPQARKTRFLEYLEPAVERANADVRARRTRLLRIAERQDRDDLSAWDRRWLADLAGRYGVDADALDERIATLERRVDTLPAALVLAQAAIESGWGTSRFAREGNNLFGQWCFQPGCGLVPRQRSEDAGHEVRAFESMAGSIRSYIRNINSHRAYRRLRALRAAARTAGRAPSALELAGGLERYSQRGAAYVEEVRAVIRVNDLAPTGPVARTR